MYLLGTGPEEVPASPTSGAPSAGVYLKGSAVNAKRDAAASQAERNLMP